MATPPIGNIDLSRGQPPYNPNMGEYLIPANRSFTWETSPQEQGLLASAMGRPDLEKLMYTGQWGPLAGQPHQYQGGRTAIGYGGGYPGGYPGGGLPPWQTGDYPPRQGQPPWQPPVPPRVPPTIGDPFDPTPPDRTRPTTPFDVDPNKWTAPTAGGFVYDPNSVIPEFDQWSMWENQRIRDQNARIQRFQDPTSDINLNFAFEDAKRRGALPTTPLQDKAAFMAMTDANRGRQASIMPPDFGRNPFAARQAAAATPSMQFGVGGGTDYGAALAQQQRQREIAMQANEFASAQRAQQQRQAAQADAMRKALGFGTPDRSVDVSDVPLAMEWRDGRARTFQPQTSAPFAQQKAEAARIAQTKPQRDAAAAVVRQTQQRDRGRAEQKREENRKSASDRKKAQAASRQKEVQRKAGVASRSREKAKAQAKAKQLITSRQQKPSPPMKKATTTRRPPRARAASAKLAQQAAARARNIAQEKKDKKRGRRGPGMGDR
jgi:hypothetical protein